MICVGIFVMFCELAAPPVPPPASTYCQIARPIRISLKDTRETKEQADRENRKWKRLCQAKAK